MSVTSPASPDPERHLTDEDEQWLADLTAALLSRTDLSAPTAADLRDQEREALAALRADEAADLPDGAAPASTAELVSDASKRAAELAEEVDDSARVAASRRAETSLPVQVGGVLLIEGLYFLVIDPLRHLLDPDTSGRIYLSWVLGMLAVALLVGGAVSAARRALDGPASAAVPGVAGQ